MPWIKPLLMGDKILASASLALMAIIPLIEVLLRPIQGQGIQNAPVLVQHLGLVMSMMGALAAQRGDSLASLGHAGPLGAWAQRQEWTRWFVFVTSSFICGLLAYASVSMIASDWSNSHALAYGIELAWVQAFMPLGFIGLGLTLGPSLLRPKTNPTSPHNNPSHRFEQLLSVGIVLAGLGLPFVFELSEVLPTQIYPLALVLMLLLGAPIFVVMGGLALLLLTSDALPLASLSLSHYQITVNPSLPALPLFTLAGLVFASTKASERLSLVFVKFFGEGRYATVLAVSVLCSCFTALTGGSGVTILALGGLLLPLLQKDGYPQTQGIGLVTSASALGVLLPPSVPLIMFAIMARVPINTMFVAGLLPALIMVISLIVFGGFLRKGAHAHSNWPTHPLGSSASSQLQVKSPMSAWQALYAAKWEALAPVVAIGFLASGLTTPMESAALTAIYAILTQTLAHKELSTSKLFDCLSQTAQIIGGVMLIMGMALGITNYLIDQGVPDLAIDWVQSITHNKYLFLLALNVFLLFAGAMMEIYAAIVVLVPLLLPLAQSYGIEPVHFGIIFLANLEIGFLCPPAGMNVYFASAVFKQPLPLVIKSVIPAAFAIFVGTLLVSWTPWLVLTLPELFHLTP